MSQEPKTKVVPSYTGTLRSHSLSLPHCVSECSGIRIFGKRIKSLAFTTDVAIVKNINADAIMAVYPFTPQPVIADAIISVADVPVFVGVGGGVTSGMRSDRLAIQAEHQGAFGVVLNAPIPNDVVRQIKADVDIPVVVTVISEHTDIQARLDAGADILNVSGAARTPEIVARIRERFPEVPIIATGGPTDESILATIRSGANAITYTPPTSAVLFSRSMERYRVAEAIGEDRYSTPIKIGYFNGNRRALRVGAFPKNPTRRWRYKNKTIVLLFMDSSRKRRGRPPPEQKQAVPSRPWPRRGTVCLLLTDIFSKSSENRGG